MDSDKFRVFLEGLKKDDVVTFIFKDNIHWATNFLAMFNVKPYAFAISVESQIRMDVINHLMAVRWVALSKYKVVCIVLGKVAKSLKIDWMVTEILPLLDSYSVKEAG